MKLKLPKKIPSLVGIVIIACLVFLVSKGSSGLFRTTTNALKSTQPRTITVNNVSDTSLTINWFTDDPATGGIILSEKSTKPQVYFDDRDTGQKQKQFTAHSVTIRDLKSSTAYEFTILSEGKKYTESTPVYTAQTASTIPDQKNTNGPIYGSVTDASDSPVINAIVFVWFDTSQTVSTPVTDSGSWLVPVNQIRYKTMNEYLNPSPNMPVHIKIQTTTKESNVTVSYSNGVQVPTVVLGKTYDFRLKAMATTPTLQPTNVPDIASVKPPIENILGVNTVSIDILKPADKAAIVVARPLFQGTAIPGNKITLVLSGINPSTYTATVAADGTWQFSPIHDIGIGRQSVTLKSINHTGKSVTVVHMYEILKSGTQVLGDATPSASLTPPVMTLISPTVEPTIQPSESPTGSQLVSPTPVTPIELKPGIGLPTFLLVGLGMLMVISGFVLFQL